MASRQTGVSEIAERYALALFELADERKVLDDVAEDLRALKAMLTESADLQRLIRSPVLSRAEQGAAVAALLKRSKANELTCNFAALVATNRRLFALPRMIDAYLTELAARRGEVTAQVTAASKLTAAQQKSLTETLKKLVGAKVAVDIKIDPELLGGLIVKLGSKLFDSSLRTKLHKLELAMKGTG